MISKRKISEEDQSPHTAKISLSGQIRRKDPEMTAYEHLVDSASTLDADDIESLIDDLQSLVDEKRGSRHVDRPADGRYKWVVVYHNILGEQLIFTTISDHEPDEAFIRAQGHEYKPDEGEYYDTVNVGQVHDTRYDQLVREVIDDVEAVQMCGEEDVRETWPDLWDTYELACAIKGVEPKIEPDDGYSQRI